MIHQEKYQQLEKLNKHVKNIKNKHFLIKLKNISN